jgi:hypothetical protein
VAECRVNATVTVKIDERDSDGWPLNLTLDSRVRLGVPLGNLNPIEDALARTLLMAGAGCRGPSLSTQHAPADWQAPAIRVACAWLGFSSPRCWLGGGRFPQLEFQELRRPRPRRRMRNGRLGEARARDRPWPPGLRVDGKPDATVPVTRTPSPSRSGVRVGGPSRLPTAGWHPSREVWSLGTLKSPRPNVKQGSHTGSTH